MPTAAGVRRAEVVIASNDGDENPFEIQLSGEGTVARKLRCSQGGYCRGRRACDQVGTNEFGATLLGKVGRTQSFTIKNVGTSATAGLVVSVTGANPGDFVVGSLGATMLAPNTTTTFTVTFVPTGGGLRQESFRLPAMMAMRII
ncbi:MAG: choice-of-anchor D domain-containing protein [Verrucomicrobiota bacterium]